MTKDRPNKKFDEEKKDDVLDNVRKALNNKSFYILIAEPLEGRFAQVIHGINKAEVVGILELTKYKHLVGESGGSNVPNILDIIKKLGEDKNER